MTALISKPFGMHLDRAIAIAAPLKASIPAERSWWVIAFRMNMLNEAPDCRWTAVREIK